MKLAIMQPYILPYIGYFQLINAVDKIVIYDNIQYTKKGWINRNRFLQDGAPSIFSVALKKDSDYLDIRDRHLSPSFDKTRLLNRIKEAYRKAPYFEETFTLLERIFLNKEDRLFHYLFFSIMEVCCFLEINTEILISSNINIDHTLRSQSKVIQICRNLGADKYINPIGGRELYSRKVFSDEGIELMFIQSKPIIYKQFNNEFIPWLSIIDIMMFNNKKEIKEMLDSYELV